MKFSKIALLSLFFVFGSAQAWEIRDLFTKESISATLSLSFLAFYYSHCTSQLKKAHDEDMIKFRREILFKGGKTDNLANIRKNSISRSFYSLTGRKPKEQL